MIKAGETMYRTIALFLLLFVPGLAALAIPQAASECEIKPRIYTFGHRSYREMIPKSLIQIDMVAIPGGEFTLGSPEGEKGRDKAEGPRRHVKIKPLWMSRTEITWDAYDLYRAGKKVNQAENEAALRKDADAITRPTPTYPDEYRDFGKEGYPVVGVSHHAAMEFCRWLSQKTGKVYRLPTEAEWEWAARAGRQGPYFFGADADKLGEYAWFEDNAKETTHPVGEKKPNPWGLHDIYGNVAEWCVDHYYPDTYSRYPEGKLTVSPVQLPTERRYSHVVRGGSWADSASRCRSAARRGSDKSWNKIDPSDPQTVWWQWDADFVGFRIVRAVEEEKELRGLRSKVTSASK